MNTTEHTMRVAFRHPVKTHTLRIGHDRFEVDSLTHASILFQELRDASGCGASQWPEGSVEVDGVTYRISYNGRIWEGKTLVMEAA
jgi:hypothetical protein